MEKEEEETTQETIVREDGCVCPAPPPPKKCGRIQTCPYDPRFPNTNQTRHCYFSFIDYQRCARLLGDYPGCFLFYRCYSGMCPTEWTDKWFDQMEKGIFPRKIYPPGPIVYPDLKKIAEACLEEEEQPVDVC